MIKIKALIIALGLVICTQMAYAVNTRDDITGISTGGGGVSEGDSPTFSNVSALGLHLKDFNDTHSGTADIYYDNYVSRKETYFNAKGVGNSHWIFSDEGTPQWRMSPTGFKYEPLTPGGPQILATIPTFHIPNILSYTGNGSTGMGGDQWAPAMIARNTAAAVFYAYTTTFYRDSANPVVVDSNHGSIRASVFSRYSTTTAAAVTIVSADTAWNCDVTNNDVIFTLYSSGPSTQGNSIEIAVTKPSGDKTCFVTAHGNQTVRSGSISFDNHSGMDTDGEAFKYYDTGRGYFMIHGGY